MITPIEKVHSVTLPCLLNCGTLQIDHLLKKLFFFLLPGREMTGVTKEQFTC